MPTLSRRQFLHSGASSLLLPAVMTPVVSATASEVKPFNFVFLTDPHIQPELRAVEGVKQCFAKVNTLETAPEFVITGGDLIMDALEVGPERVHEQWKLWDEVMKLLPMRAYHTIGNHDVCGWSKKALVKPNEQDYGKKEFADRYGKGQTYQSFDHVGWHFIILDSIGQEPDLEYKGWIDDDQLTWLKGDLEKTGRQTPIILVTHIPFFSVWHQVLLGPKVDIGGKALVGNVFEFRKMLNAYNIKLVLSGHGHILERIKFDKVTYLQGGAVSGLWWKGPVQGNPEGFLQITCHPDGHFEDQYVSYDWKAGA
jgi:3',5'-cyclic-AMP phosphodiesterase